MNICEILGKYHHSCLAIKTYKSLLPQSVTFLINKSKQARKHIFNVIKI